MIQYNLYFEICSIPIYLIMLIATLSRKMIRGRSNYSLNLILISGLLAAISDTTGNYILTKPYPLSDLQVLAVKVLNYIYYFFRSASITLYIFYIYSVTRTWYKIRQIWKRLIILMPFLIIVTLLVINISRGNIFYVTNQTGYHRGAQVLAVYFCAAFYMFYGIIYLIYRRKLLKTSEWVSLTMLYIPSIVGVIIQYFKPETLVECFFTSLTFLFVIIFVQKPEKQVDMNTTLPGYFAFKEEMGKIQATKQKVQVVIARISNAEQLLRYLGEKAYYEYMHSIGIVIEHYAKEEKLTIEFYFENPGCFYIILENIDYNPVQAIPYVREKVRGKSGKVSDTGASIDLKIVTIAFPDDIENVNDLLWFGHNFIRFTEGKIYCHASQILSQRTYQIETRLDDILGRAIDNGQLKINYNPVWSVKEGKALFAEAVTTIHDEIFGEIDADTLRVASEARGTNMLMEDYVMERVFAYLGSNKVAKEYYEYIIIHLSSSLGMQKNFTDRVWTLRNQYNVNPAFICFAISDTVYDMMRGGLYDNIRKLTLQGYRLGIDGYGNGYSNIKNIVELPISTIRLDRTMITEVETEQGKALLSGLIQMLNNIPIPVVAPAVDNFETKEMLTNMGCDLMQGAYFEREKH